MRTRHALLLSMLISISVARSAAKDFDFFYFVLQWPGSYCDTQRRCCYPTTGKPAADFGIHGLWPNNEDGSYPSNCDPGSQLDASQISDLRGAMEANWPTLACPSGDGFKFWAHEWAKHGTCSESLLSQHDYFETALNLKKQLNLLEALNDAGIQPGEQSYSQDNIVEAITRVIGGSVGIQCNVDASSGNSQLYQIYVCVDSAAAIIDCPVLPESQCSSQMIEFPAF